jgi:hypothetical protein
LVDFGALFSLGFLICFLVLLCIGIMQLSIHRWFCGLLKIGLAALAGWLFLSESYVRA